jgi:hypothetical protein
VLRLFLLTVAITKRIAYITVCEQLLWPSMWRLSVKKRTRSATTGSASDTESPRLPATDQLIAGLRRRRAWWTSRKRRTKAVLATFFVTLGTFIGLLANGIAVWDWVWHNPQQPTRADASSVHASSVPTVLPLPTCLTCTTGKTFPERVWPKGMGARTFRNPLGFGGEGKRVKPRQRVQVVCRFQQQDAPASVYPGWWYLIASPPWNRQYYSPANSYLNGDPLEGPYIATVNNGVPVC